jgi:hypothetical protein
LIICVFVILCLGYNILSRFVKSTFVSFSKSVPIYLVGLS